jgi:hypothetical protein
MTYRRIIAVVLVLVIAVLIAVSLRGRRAKGERRNSSLIPSPLSLSGPGYQFGLVAVDTVLRRIAFPAQVARDTGQVLTLVGLTGYPWVQAVAAITSPARLLDLQSAIAALDWALWDSLWMRHHPNRSIALRLDALLPESIVESGTAPVFGEPKAGAVPDTLSFSDYVFLGIPEFDQLVLSSGEDANCSACPALIGEQKIISETMRRKSGMLGFRLRPGTLPKPGARITVNLVIGRNHR